MGFEDQIVDAFVNLVVARVMERITQVGVTTPRLLNVEQAAVYLGRSENAIRRLQASGTLRATKIDGRVQFDKSDLDTLINNSKL